MAARRPAVQRDNQKFKKLKEKSWVELVRRCWPEVIPRGILEQPDPPAPDILIRAEGGDLGVEVSRLLPAAGTMNYPPISIRDAQQDALTKAQRRYEADSTDRLFVNVSFVSGALPREEQLVNELLHVVATHRPALGEEFRVLATTHPSLRQRFPAWVQALTIFHLPEGQQAQWCGGSVWQVPMLERVQIELAIAEKTRKLAGYRSAAPTVWLLLVCNSAGVVAEDIQTPLNAENWTFEHAFDRVLLLSHRELLTF